VHGADVLFELSADYWMPESNRHHEASQEPAWLRFVCDKNLSYFYRLFKRAYGFPPKAYRQHAQKGFL
jgi:hypothetical protein